MSIGWSAVHALSSREIVRFLRQRSRVVGALGTPIVFWLLIGSGIGRSFRPPDATETIGYLEYALPGSIVLVLLFTAVFATISVIEDRAAGFLQGVLVSPIPRWSLVLGKTIGGTVLAVGQGAVMLLLAPAVGVRLTPGGVVASVAVMSVVGMALSCLGFCIAWRMDSTQGFHAIMNLFLVPMWLLSGAFFPASGAAGWLRWVMLANPLTYGVSLLRAAMYTGGSSPVPSGSTAVNLAITMAFAGIMLVGATYSCMDRGERDIA